MSAAADTAEKILDAAAELFAERGYAATTTRLIAERAGVNEVTIFRRFENKLGVLRLLAERFAREQSAPLVMDAVPDPEDTRATLLAMARREVANTVRNGGVALRLAFDARSVPEVAELLGEGPRLGIQALAKYMADRQAAGELRDDIDPLVMAEAYGALTSSYVMYRVVMGVIDKPEDMTSDETVEKLFDLFWSGAQVRGDEK